MILDVGWHHADTEQPPAQQHITTIYYITENISHHHHSKLTYAKQDKYWLATSQTTLVLVPSY